MECARIVRFSDFDDESEAFELDGQQVGSCDVAMRSNAAPGAALVTKQHQETRSADLMGVLFCFLNHFVVVPSSPPLHTLSLSHNPALPKELQRSVTCSVPSALKLRLMVDQ